MGNAPEDIAGWWYKALLCHSCNGTARHGTHILSCASDCKAPQASTQGRVLTSPPPPHLQLGVVQPNAALGTLQPLLDLAAAHLHHKPAIFVCVCMCVCEGVVVGGGWLRDKAGPEVVTGETVRHAEKQGVATERLWLHTANVHVCSCFCCSC